MRIPLGENQPVAEAPSQEFAPALRLDEVVAIRVEHVQERAVAGGDDEAVFHPCAEVDEAFVGDVAQPVDCYQAPWVAQEHLCAD